ncbi:2,3-diaminopropionate biosynthesis protein SbnB [Kitasatospora sp. NPDC085464]|uniref:2,3-diaminopropionate biosynthesis protein SbnB n=1 Tax=Kitasatospora sp. NPDC085464 TaxID=3364063 RepID=UPI0037C7D253
MLILRHDDVRRILDGRTAELIDLVAEAYRAHHEGRSSLPHSVFLRFPEQPADRVIGLPGYLGGERPVAGMKWIASFPGNLAAGLARASAVMVLNSPATGHPEALVEASLISARRTAASAALAAGLLLPEGGAGTTGVTLVGTGVINGEVLAALRVRLPDLAEVTVHDRDPERAERFARVTADETGLKVGREDSLPAALAAHGLVSFATTAGGPYVDPADVPAGSTVLHVSLRDLHPETVLGSRNVVDDADHVCRERTSLHLTEQRVGNREFIEAEIGALIGPDAAPFVRDREQTVVFSPFGLGVLDLALADFVRHEARRQGLGLTVDGFLPQHD